MIHNEIKLPHTHQFAHPRIAVGSALNTPEDVALIRANGITHVVDCQADPISGPLYEGTPVIWMHCPTLDDGELKGAEWFHRGARFALSALEQPDTRVLFHCWAGINRGPSMAYLVLRAMGYGPAKAEHMIRRVRPLVGLRYISDAEQFLSEDWL